MHVERLQLASRKVEKAPAIYSVAGLKVDPGRKSDRERRAPLHMSTRETKVIKTRGSCSDHRAVTERGPRWACAKLEFHFNTFNKTRED